MIDKQARRFFYVSLLILGSILFVSCGGNGNQPEPDVNLRPTVGFSKIGNATRADFNGQVFVAARNVVVEMVAAESPRGNSPVARVELTIKDSSGNQISQEDVPEPFKTTVDFSSSGGVYTLAAVAIDASGRRSVQATQQVTVDTQAPTTASFSLLVNGVSTTNFSQPIQISETGTVALQVAVNDTINGANASNAGNDTTKVYLTIDGQVKKIGAAGVLSTILTANSSATGDQFVKLAVGSYTVGVFAVDGAGNAAQIRTFRLKIVSSDGEDITKPVVAINQPQNNAKVRGKIGLQIDIQEPESEITRLLIYDGNTLLVEETGVSKGIFVKEIDTTTLDEGMHTLRVVVVNSEGLSDTKQVVVNIDNTAPIANWLKPLENAVLSGDNVTLQITAKDTNGIAADGVSFTFGSIAVSGTVVKTGDTYALTFDTTKLGLADGTYMLKAMITDTFGNATEISRQVTLSNTDTTPPTLQWVKPSSGTVVREVYSLEVDVTDKNNKGEASTVATVEIFAGSQSLGQAVNTVDNIWRLSWNTSEYANGAYTLRAVAKDGADNTAEARVNTTVSNAASPTGVTITQPAVNAKLRGEVSLQVQIDALQSKVTQLLISDNGNVIATEASVETGLFTKEIDTTTLTDGEHIWRVFVTNEAGLRTDKQVKVYVDNTVPAVNWIEPLENAKLTGLATLKIRATDANGIAADNIRLMLGTVAVPGAASKADDVYTLTFDSVKLGLADGAYTLKAAVPDTFGNITEITRPVILSNVDTTAPTLKWVKPAAGEVVRDVYSLEIDVTDTNNKGEVSTVAQVEIFAGSQSLGQAVNTVDNIWRLSWKTSDFANGAYTLRAVAKDSVDNTAEARVNTTISNAASATTLTITQPAANARLRGKVSLQVQVEDAQATVAQLLISDNGNVIVNETGVAVGLFTKEIDTTTLTDGEHIWRVFVTNKAGLSTDKQIKVYVDNTLPVVNWVEPLENAKLTGSTTLKIRATDANGIESDKVSFMLAAVSIPGTVNKTGDVYELTFNSATLGLADGVYTLKAQVVDVFGNITEVTRQVSLSNVDTTPPTLVWETPKEGATIGGKYSLEVNVVDQDNQGVRGEVRSVKMFAGSQQIGEAQNTVNDIWRFSWDTSQVVDGRYSLRAVAQDNGGNSAEATVNITVANTIPLGASMNIANIVPLAVYEPADTTCSAALDGVQLPCYAGILNIPVSVDDETGTATVTLIVESKALGTLPLGVATKAPYAFTLNTSNYPNNDALKITARVKRTQDGKEVTSGAVQLGVFNQYPLPNITITSPSNDDKLQGLVNVTMNINQPSPTSYTLDLNQDDKVDSSTDCKDNEGTGYREGMLVQFVDFTNRVIAEQYVDANMQAETSGTYITSAPFKTIDFANDTYLIRLTAILRNKDASASDVCAGSQGTVVSEDNFITLRRTIQVSTENTNKVPPALLITSPVNRTPTDIPTYGSVGYLSFVATDNTGISYVELRIFSADDDQEANQTPSRRICATGDATSVVAALPFTPDADPYLPNADNYTVRVIAQDTDGNRTQQEVKINIKRLTGSTASYRLAQVSPLERFKEDPDNPNLITRIGIQNPVLRNTAYGLELINSDNNQSSNPENPTDPTKPLFPVSSRGDDPPEGSKFTHIYLGGSCGATPLGINGSYEGFTDSREEEGSYSYITQITHPDGTTYLSNVASVGVRDLDDATE